MNLLGSANILRPLQNSIITYGENANAKLRRDKNLIPEFTLVNEDVKLASLLPKGGFEATMSSGF